MGPSAAWLAVAALLLAAPRGSRASAAAPVVQPDDLGRRLADSSVAAGPRRSLGAKNLRGRAKFAKPDWAYYHKVDETYALTETYAAKCPALDCVRVSETTDPSYTVENSMVCTATAAQPEKPTIPMLMVFGEHARELISSEIALRLVAMLCALLRAIAWSLSSCSAQASNVSRNGSGRPFLVWAGP